MSIRVASEASKVPLRERYFLTLGARNDFLHTYPDVDTMLAEHDIGAGVQEKPAALEFFDSHGQRYAGVYDPQWRLLDLVPSADPPDLEQLRRRVEAVRAHLRSFI